jgi:hypothetical protein
MSDLWVVLFGILMTWLVITIPICVLYLIGCPPVMSLSPLLPSRESRAYKNELRKRPQLDDDSFFARFYGETDVPKDIPIGVRKVCMEEMDRLLSRIEPDDLLSALDDELGLAEVLHQVESQFGVKFSMEEMRALDGSFDSVVQLLKAKRCNSRNGS